LIDKKQNLYIDDYSNNVIRRVGGTSVSEPKSLAKTLLAANKQGVFVNKTNNFDIAGNADPKVNVAVSPNGDGVNDVLLIDNIASYPQNKLMLTDRNGAKIYEASGYDNAANAFSGRSNITNKVQQPGTYFYVLEYKQKGAIKRKTGYFIIKY
jgi:gliding motility-associated-like protein